jgi:hypothetical protein
MAAKANPVAIYASKREKADLPARMAEYILETPEPE